MNKLTQRERWTKDNELNQSFLSFADADYQAPLAVRMFFAHAFGMLRVWQSVGAALLGKPL